MARWFNLVESSCADQAREEEFNSWYNNVHIPDVLSCPGFVAATRYQITEPLEGRGRYVAVYEIETDDIEKTMEERGQRREAERARGRNSDLIAGVSQARYQVQGDFGNKSRPRWANIVETNCAEPSREDEFRQWYDGTHIPDVLQTPGFSSATRAELQQPQEGRGKFLVIYDITAQDLGRTMTMRRGKRAWERAQGRYSDLISHVSEAQYRIMGIFHPSGG